VEKTVDGAAISVEYVLNMGGHVRNHPRGMLHSAVAVGYLCGGFFFRGL
jgi:hypothetical protein